MSRRSLQFAIVVFGAAFAFAACHNTRADPKKIATAEAKTQGEDQNLVRLVKNPDLAPALKVNDLDGKPISLDDLKGKIVLLNFWATWCGPCRAEIPDLIDLQKKYKENFAIVALATDEDDPELVKKFSEKAGINYRIGMST